MPHTRDICKHCGVCACDDCKAEAKENGGKCRHCGKPLEIEKQTKGADGWEIINVQA